MNRKLFQIAVLVVVAVVATVLTGIARAAGVSVISRFMLPFVGIVGGLGLIVVEIARRVLFVVRAPDPPPPAIPPARVHRDGE